MKKIKIIQISVAALVLLISCKKDFLNKPSLNAPTLDTYYTNPAQVRAATGYLYNSLWYSYIDKAMHNIGEVLGGNMLSENGPNYGGGSFISFNFLSTDPQVGESWTSFYKAAGNATALIKTFEQKKASVADASYLNEGIAEARFIRGAAYFFIARTFGDAPIVADPVALAASGDYNVPKYFQKDVLRFAREDFEYAEANLGEVPSEKGRVSKYSASGMIAKLYLYQGNYAAAKIAANKVIASGKYDLYSDYQKMFTSSSANNNIESLFALQWAATGGYGFGNPIQIYAAPQALLKPSTNAGYSSVIPSIDLLRSYEAGDLRKGWSVMQQGFFKPEWKTPSFPNGFTYDTTTGTDNLLHVFTGTRSSSLKYIVGPPTTAGEVVDPGGFSNMNTYMLRYADVLLIYAEATLGTAASTNDATALAAFNRVRTRAGLPALSSLTKDIILHERRVELAFEGDYWYDVQRQGYTKASQIINAQERGTYSYDGSTINHQGASFNTPAKLYLPIPQAETVSDPKLLEPAVAYYP